MELKNLPIGVQTFSKLIKGNYLYVDKTKDIYNLLANGGQYYFLSRPRRFGKSLLVSTLKELFSGNRDLFKGLWIYDKIDWKTYPVVHIDFSKIRYKTPEILEKSLEKKIRKIARNYNIRLDNDVDFKEGFGDLIEELSKKNRVVILVDEYDKPIIDKIDEQETALGNRDVLKQFYGVIKASDEFNHFAFITGVSKFSKVSVFSDMNNLIDITIDDQFATMLGYTHDELLRYFKNRIQGLAKEELGEKEQLVEDIKTWYNGYSWDGENFVYNPFSVLIFFQKKQFGNYWFETGSPSFLLKLINKYNINITELENYKAGEAIFSSFDIDRMHVVSLLFQTGYLTIKKIEFTSDRKKFYYLGYPDKEVKEALMEYLLGDFSMYFAEKISVILEKLKESLRKNDMDQFFETIRSLFVNIPYDMFVKDREGYYQTVIYLILKLIGIDISTEVETNIGRIDALVETDTHIYVMEFKLGTAEEALNQIKEKKYYEKYLTSSKVIDLIGIGFDIEQKNIGDYKIEELQR
jgi:hypothetical protein